MSIFAQRCERPRYIDIDTSLAAHGIALVRNTYNIAVGPAVGTIIDPSQIPA